MLRSRARTRGRFPAVESEYSVLGKTPGLIADFKNEFYRPNAGANRFSDLITHARAGNATMTDSDGLIKWAPHNLLTYSEDFTQSVWTKFNCGITSNTVVSPDGGLTADTLTSTGDGAAKQLKVLDTVEYTSNIWLKVPSGTLDVNLYIINNNATVAATTTVTVTTEWRLFSLTGTPSATTGGAGGFQFGGANTLPAGKVIYLWGAHAYRSDLGGMVDNPDRGDSYVPTTSSAVYLPRRGHHKYNGDQWVNKGILVESEARTNLIDYSDLSSGDVLGSTFSLNSLTSPDGNVNAGKLTATSTNPSYVKYSSILVSGDTYTVSVYAKAGNNDIIRIANVSSAASGQWYDLTNGLLLTSNDTGGNGHTASIEHAGNGWYRCTRTFFNVSTGSTDEIFVANSEGDGLTGSISGSYVYLYGIQVERNNATPSSYIPTNGSTVTRAAETVTVPYANLPWPTPTYIGDELVTNGTFDTDSNWTKAAGVTISGGVANFAAVTGPDVLYQNCGITALKRYAVTADVTGSGTVSANVGGNSPTGVYRGAGSAMWVIYASSGANGNLTFYASSFTGTIDNVSVREINPLSMSIAMMGEMDYADDGTNTTYPFRIRLDTSNQILSYIDTSSTKTGQVVFFQEASGVIDFVASGSSTFTPDLNVPFNIASRHGSTFVNGAVDGVALTANTTPVALPDLSTIDLEIGYIYMGTVSEFRMWDRDIQDTGIAEATAPSLEPSLSLSFDSTESSFVDKGWSE